MISFISHETALEFWRSKQASKALALQRQRIVRLTIEIPEQTEQYNVNPWGLSLPLHVLVSNGNTRKVNKYLDSHVCSVQLPDYSFIRVDPDLIVSVPELCIIQMADILEKIELVQLAIEFCGGYRLANGAISERSFDEAPALTSTAKLSAYIDKAVGLKGRKKAAAALRYIADGSASPMETIMVMRLTLPFQLGGHSLPMPALNYPIYVQGRDMPLYIADGCWPEAKLIVEYNSKQYHALEPGQVARDEIRRNDLTAMGYQVIVMTSNHLSNTSLLNKTVAEICRILGRRQQYPAGFAQRQAKLRWQLMPWLYDEDLERYDH